MAEIRLYPCESSITYYIIKHGRLPKPIMSTDDTIYNKFYRDRILGINKPIIKPHQNHYLWSDNEESTSVYNDNSYYEYEYEYDSSYNYEEETITHVSIESDTDTISDDKEDDENHESNSIDD